MPFCLVRPRVGETTPFSMSTEEKKKTTALREASMPQPRTAQPCRCRQFDLPLPRTHAHLFARRWLGACMPPPMRPAKVQQSPGELLQQQNGPKECFPNAGYRVSSARDHFFNPFPTPGISSRAQSTPCTLRPATAPRPLGLGGRPRAHPDRTRARYNRTRVGEV